jgi:hypothetical protein
VTSHVIQIKAQLQIFFLYILGELLSFGSTVGFKTLAILANQPDISLVVFDLLF